MPRLYARRFDSSVWPHTFFTALCRYSKTFKKLFCQWTWFKFNAINLFFKSLEELAKHQQKILCGQTHESKCLVYRHILERIVKIL